MMHFSIVVITITKLFYDYAIFEHFQVQFAEQLL